MSEEETTDDTQQQNEAGEQITMTKAEADALRREVAESRKQARTAQREADKRAEEQAKKDGDFQKAAEAAEKRAQEAEDRALGVERKARVTQAAARLQFRDPADVSAFLDPEVLDDDAALDRALKQLKKDKPYLAETEARRSGGQITGDQPTRVDMDSLIRRAAGRS